MSEPAKISVVKNAGTLGFGDLVAMQETKQAPNKPKTPQSPFWKTFDKRKRNRNGKKSRYYS